MKGTTIIAIVVAIILPLAFMGCSPPEKHTELAGSVGGDIQGFRVEERVKATEKDTRLNQTVLHEMDVVKGDRAAVKATVLPPSRVLSKMQSAEVKQNVGTVEAGGRVTGIDLNRAPVAAVTVEKKVRRRRVATKAVTSTTASPDFSSDAAILTRRDIGPKPTGLKSDKLPSVEVKQKVVAVEAGGSVTGVDLNRAPVAAVTVEKTVKPMRVRRKAVTSTTVSPDFSSDAALLTRRDAYLKELKQASFTFNPPSPIKVATPVTVYFWLDPLLEPTRLAEELAAQLLKMRPDEKPLTEAGRIDWSPKMRATLTGNDFDITPTESEKFDGLKSLSSTRRTEWSWDVKAKHIGEQLPLHLRIWAVLPQELGEPYEVLKLDKLITVKVTLFWLVDEYWEKYWKWILGAMGTAFVGIVSAWWRSRHPNATGN